MEAAGAPRVALPALETGSDTLPLPFAERGVTRDRGAPEGIRRLTSNTKVRGVREVTDGGIKDRTDHATI